MTTNIKVIPAPTGGWNARDPLHAMAEGDAIELVNLFPATASVVNRGAYTTRCDMSGVASRLGSLMTYLDQYLIVYGKGTGGTGKFWRVDAYNSFVDITPASGTRAITLTRELHGWNFTNFNGKLFAVCQGSNPVDYSAGTMTATAWTGPVNIKDLSHVCNYKGRLYFTYAQTTTIWYSALNGVTGALSPYNLSPFLTRGGAIVATGTTTKQGPVNQLLFFALSESGEVLVFQGDYPGADTWSIVGRYYVSRPVGMHYIIEQASGCSILTETGIVSVDALLNNQVQAGGYVTITEKVKNGFAGKVPVSPLCSAIEFAPHKSLLVNLASENGGDASQVVQNIENKAWCTYEGINAYSIIGLKSTELGDYIFATEENGTDIKYLKAPGDLTTDSMTCSARCAFNFLDDPTTKKSATRGKVFFDFWRHSELAEDAPVVEFGIDTDFADDDTLNDLIIYENTEPGYQHYAIPVEIRGEGAAFSALLKVTMSLGYKFAWNLSMVEYEPSTGGL